MLIKRAENIEIEDENKIVPMLLTDGIDYRCSSCGQRLTEGAKRCPICKSVFVESSVIIRKADIVPENRRYMKRVENIIKNKVESSQDRR